MSAGYDGRLLTEVASWPNLLLAWRKARKGKRLRPDVSLFDLDAEGELLALRRELVTGTWEPGPFRHFLITDPKERLVSAAPFRDRVLHHAVMNVLEPRLDRTFIEDTFACRTGKGLHAAVARAKAFAGGFPWALKADAVKCFPSMDHEILKAKIERRVSDRRLLDEVLFRIVDAGGPEPGPCHHFPGDDLMAPVLRRRGVPIGNLTSQVFANLYLDDADRFIKQRLRVRGYVRYCDDLLLFGQSPAELAGVRDAVAEALALDRLRLHERKTQVFSMRDGVPFLGFVVGRGPVRLRAENRRRIRRRMAETSRKSRAGEIDLVTVRQRLMGIKGFATFPVGGRCLVADLIPRFVY